MASEDECLCPNCGDHQIWKSGELYGWLCGSAGWAKQVRTESVECLRNQLHAARAEARRRIGDSEETRRECDAKTARAHFAASELAKAQVVIVMQTKRIENLEAQVEAANNIALDARRAERFEAACAALIGYRAADGECAMQANTVATMAQVDADALLARLAETAEGAENGQ